MRKLSNHYWILFVFILYLCSCEEKGDTFSEVEVTRFFILDQRNIKHELHVDNETNLITNKRKLPIYVNLSRLIVEFDINNKDAIPKINNQILQSGQSEIDFSKEVICEIHLADKKQKSYTVKIIKDELSNNFQSFAFPERQMNHFQPAINLETSEITNENKIPANVDITSLQPVFTTRETDAVVKVNGNVQISGVSKHDFTNPVVYVVEGQDGTTKEFVVRLTRSNDIHVLNPVIEGDYPDPTVIRVGDMFYLYVTGGIVRGYKSTDLVNWSSIAEGRSEVFNARPDFTEDNVHETGMWAPDINYFDEKYVMYYSISKWGGGATCGIGIGVSEKPEGPFLPPEGNSNGKLFVSSEIGVHNSIDPCFFEDNGKRFIFWGSWGGIHMTELTDDGMEVKDLTTKKQVAGTAFEAVYIHKKNNYYYLFASIGACCEGMNSSYKVVVGRSENIDGPYVSKAGKDMNDYNSWDPYDYSPVVIRGNDYFAGPGHNARIITDDNGTDWMLYHSYADNGRDERNLLMEKVEWDEDGWPFVSGGTPSFSVNSVPVFY